MPSEAVSVLMGDHEEVLRHLKELDAELDDDQEAALERLELLEDEMERHFDDEEDALFPEVEGEVPLDEVLEEHEDVWREFDRLKEDVEFAVEEGPHQQVRGRFALFLGAIRSHIYREDEKLFPEIDGILSEDEAVRAFEQMERR